MREPPIDPAARAGGRGQGGVATHAALLERAQAVVGDRADGRREVANETLDVRQRRVARLVRTCRTDNWERQGAVPFACVFERRLPG